MSSLLDAPGLHARLRDPEALAALAARWLARPALRIDEALAPGLTAELAAAVSRLPFAAVHDPVRGEVRWRCIVTLPPRPDPQLPECLFRLVRVIAHELPPVVASITGRRLRAPEPARLTMCGLRKGSYADDAVPDAPAGGLEVVLGLSGGAWPVERGGTTELLDGDGAVIERWAPGVDTLDLVDAGQRRRVGVVTRHVESLAIAIALEAA